MHLYDDIAKEVYRDGGTESRSLSLLFFLLSFLFHFSMLLLIQQWGKWEPARIDSGDSFVQLVDPETLLPAPPKPRNLLFGTDREKDLKSIPPGKETKLPPIPKSVQPGLPPMTRGGKSPGGASRPRVPPSLPSAPPAPVPSLPLPERPTVPDAALPPAGDASPPAAEEAKRPLSLPSLPPGQGEVGSDDLSAKPGGLPGLPFADAKSLDRLAKVFSDQEQVPKDTISLNTDDLKYFSYTLKLKNKIEYIWRYPQAAAERGIQGDLLLNFTIQKDGHVSEVKVVSTSGYEILDQEAVRAIKEASPFAPLPDSWNEDRITITGHFMYYNRYTSLR